MSLFTLHAWACIAAGLALAVTTAAGTDVAGLAWAALRGAGKGFASYVANGRAVPFRRRARFGRWEADAVSSG